MIDDQDDAFGEVVQHGVRGEVHQVAAIDERDDLHARGQDVIVQLLHFRVNALQRRVGVRAFAQEHDAGNHIVVVDDLAVLAMNGSRELAEADLWALAATTAISPMRSGVPFLAVITVFSMSLTSFTRPTSLHVDLLQAGFDEAAARVGVVVGELLLHLRRC